jgi:hypothetical protein
MDALSAPPVDWEGIARKAVALAHDQQRFIATVTHEPTTTRELAA